MLSSQATKAVFNILRIRRRFGFLELKDMFKIFDSVVKPILCFGSQIWGYSIVNKIEKVQIKFC